MFNPVYRYDLIQQLNRPGFPGECFICELRLPDHRFRWKHNKLFLWICPYISRHLLSLNPL
ncbi:hypothetical protein GY512_004758, partial [Escherichia coli]|nr:hypothetical protein [Escherichia coli]